MEQITTPNIESRSRDQEWPDELTRSPLREVLAARELIRSLTLRDIRSRYKQSVLGIAWALLQPLVMMVVFTVVFSGIAKVRTEVPYPLFAYTGLLPWTFFSQGLTAGTECLVANFSLITKIYFPREVFPVSAILGKVADLGVGVCLLIPLFVVYSVNLTWMIALIIPVVAVQFCFMLGMSFALSAINLFYRDVRHVVPLMLTVWMYLTPVVYPLEEVPRKYLSLYMLNPMTPIIDSYRRVLILGEMPAWGSLGIAALISIAVLFAGYRLFKRLEPGFAEMI